METFIWKNTDNAPALSKKSRKNIEFILCYEKQLNPSNSYEGRTSDNDDAPLLNTGNPVTTLTFKPKLIQFKIPDGVYEKGVYEKIELLNDLEIVQGVNSNSISLRGTFKWQQSFLDQEVTNGTYFLIKSNKFSIRYQREIASILAPDKLIDQSYLSKSLGVETNEDSKKHIDSLKIKFNSFPKPETLLAFLIKAVSKENDIILDFHLGSGTTAATALKMKRRFIGIEQMDYIENVTIERLKKVIAGEQGGISKTINWQGGGSFIYAELMKSNQQFIDEIQVAKSDKDLSAIWLQMQETAFLSYKIIPEQIKKDVHEFEELAFEDKQKFLIDILDKNLLYVNKSEINSQSHHVSDYDKEMNRKFYSML